MIGRAQYSKNIDKNDVKMMLEKKVKKWYQNDANMDPNWIPTFSKLSKGTKGELKGRQKDEKCRKKGIPKTKPKKINWASAMRVANPSLFKAYKAY